MKLKKFILCLLSASILFSGSAFADSGSAGRKVFKARIDGFQPGGKKRTDTNGMYFGFPSAFYPASTNTSLGNGLGASASLSYFLSDNVAVEVSAAMFYRKLRSLGNSPQYTVSGSTLSLPVVTGIPYEQFSKAKLFPFTAMMQFHMAPYGALSPYVGVGLHYMLGSASRGAKIGSSFGPAVQLGFDSYASENRDVSYNFEIKKLISNKTKVSFKNNTNAYAFDNTVPIQTKLDLSPIIISVGAGMRF